MEKNRIQHGERHIYFTRVVVARAKRGHQTLHSQNKFFFLVAQYIQGNKQIHLISVVNNLC